jgi:tyrosine-protein phosphatase YwqE
MHDRFVDIHCHLLPGIDDGSPNWETSLAMARMAVADGTRTIIATAHQLGNFSQNPSGAILSHPERNRGILRQQNPAMVARGELVPTGRRTVARRGWKRFFSTGKAEQCAA